MMRQSRRLAGKIRALFIGLLILSARGLPEDREAMWSVPRPFKHAYFALLVALGAPPLAVIIAESAATVGGQSWWLNVIQVIIMSATRFAPVGLGSAIALLIVVHIGAIIMSLYHAIANRWVKPVIENHEARGRNEGLVEGRAEGRNEGLVEGRAEGRNEGLVEGMTEGRAAERAEWREWLNRKDEAEARGLPFDEPAPDEE